MPCFLKLFFLSQNGAYLKCSMAGAVDDLKVLSLEYHSWFQHSSVHKKKSSNNSQILYSDNEAWDYCHCC
jgi:hypothetical protein